MIELVGFSNYVPLQRPGFKSAGSSAVEARSEGASRPVALPNAETADEVDLVSSFRSAKVQAVRGEIEAGTYETSERIAGTVSRLIDVIA